MILLFLIKKLYQIFALLFFLGVVLFAGLQVKKIQLFLINYFTKDFVTVNFESCSGFFPTDFCLKNIEIKNQESKISVDEANFLISSNFLSFENVSIKNVSVDSNSKVALSDFGGLFVFLKSDLILNSDIAKISLGSKIITNLLYKFHDYTGLKTLNFLYDQTEFNSSFKFDQTTLFVNFLVGEISGSVFCDTKENAFNLKINQLDKNFYANGFFKDNLIAGTFNFFNNNFTFKCLFENNLIALKIFNEKYNSTGRFTFDFSTGMSAFDEIMIFGDEIIIDPFFIKQDLKIPEINILFKKGNIKISDICLQPANFSFGDILFDNISLDQFKNFNFSGIINGKGNFYNKAENIDLKIKNFSIGNLNFGDFGLKTVFYENKLAFKTFKINSKYGNSIDAEIESKNWLPHSKSKIKMKALGNFPYYKSKFYGGNLDYKLEIIGILEKPLFSGHLNITDGFYINPELNIYIKNFEMLSNVKNNVINIAKIYAIDDFKEGGKLQGTGKIKAHLNSIESDILLKFDNFSILEIKGFDGKLFGDLNIKGNPTDQLKITGKLYSKNSKYNISNMVMNSTRALDLIESNKSKKQIVQKLELPIKTSLDIKFTFDPNLKIYGYGIESIWEGGADISGDLTNIKYLGKLILKKGFVNVSNKKFKLTNGEIIADSSKKNLYEISIEATKVLDRITVSAKFIQNDKKSDVKFYSLPAVSKKNILSYILFEKMASEISASEGLTLFTIMNKLAEGGSSFDFIDKFQSVLGIDSIEFKKHKNDTRGEYEAIRIVKSIGKMKLSIDQGAAKDTTKITLEANVVKNTKVSVDLSGSEAFGAGILWGKRY